MLIICPEILDQMIRLAVDQYPNEACGILKGEKGGNSVTEFVPCKNSYDELHARDPQTYPRTAQTAYWIDAREQQRILALFEQEGMEAKGVFHSHTDHDAYFSAEDRLIAAPWGGPIYPQFSYVVVSVWNKKFKEANQFCWDEKKKEFVGSPLLR